MFPWVYEFHWTIFHITFLVVFFSLFGVIVATVVKAMHRSGKDFETRKVEKILWHSEFSDLPPAARVCRHEINGEIKERCCGNEFDCRTCIAHPAFLAQQLLKPQTEPVQFNVLGFSMPPYRKYHRGHAWVQEESDGTYKIGLDDFGERLIGKWNHVELPPIGAELHANGTGWFVQKGNTRLRILSPIDGKVVDHGDNEKGWLLKVQAKDQQNALDHLLHGTEIRPWITREMERLQFSFATNDVGVTLADGGEIVPDFHKDFPKTDWDNVLGQMFLEA
jgi:glycine cleavage system H lipoate-binding protein